MRNNPEKALRRAKWQGIAAQIGALVCSIAAIGGYLTDLLPGSIAGALLGAGAVCAAGSARASLVIGLLALGGCAASWQLAAVEASYTPEVSEVRATICHGGACLTFGTSLASGVVCIEVYGADVWCRELADDDDPEGVDHD